MNPADSHKLALKTAKPPPCSCLGQVSTSLARQEAKTVLIRSK